ncbi:MAG: TIGR00645 family protein, partial [Gammaproteobacteria bacterium]|nr:TIGR00645 family protein [Gammaproteobacteria bacterium]
MKSLEHTLENWLFASRWLLAPFYGGLVVAIALLLIKFTQEFIYFAPTILDADLKMVMLKILVLVDITLLANLLLIIIFAGYETFVSKIDHTHSEDRLSWMGKVDFSGLKIKLFGSIVAISGIELLKAFLLFDEYTDKQLMWLVIIHLTFVISGLLFTYMDKVSAQTKKVEHEADKVNHNNSRDSSEN